MRRSHQPKRMQRPNVDQTTLNIQQKKDEN